MLFNNRQITVLCAYIPQILSALYRDNHFKNWAVMQGFKKKGFLYFLNFYMGQLFFILFVTIKEVIGIRKENNYINFFF